MIGSLGKVKGLAYKMMVTIVTVLVVTITGRRGPPNGQVFASIITAMFSLAKDTQPKDHEIKV